MSFFVLPAVLAALREGLTPLDVARLKTVGGASISPDGQYILYSVYERSDPSAEDFKNGNATPTVYLYDVSEGSRRVFLSENDQPGSVHWTADSQFITFLSKRGDDEHRSLYRIPVDGGEAQKVLSYETGISSYSLSPDGNRVAFTATPPVGKDKKKMQEKGFDQEVFEEEWRNGRLFVTRLEADTKELEPLPVEGHVSDVAWSPKRGDDRLLIVKAKDPSVDASLMYRRVFIVDTKGNELAAISNPGKLGPLAWSPDASQVAMTAGVDINDPDNAMLFVADSKSGRMTNLTEGLEAGVDTFDWMNNGTILAAMSFGADSKLVKVTTGGKRSDYQWNPSLNYDSVKVSENGRVVTVADSSQHPPELFFDGKRLTDSNPWLKNRELAEQKLVRFKARDGLELEGILISALSANGPAPTILTVHGGPESHYNDGWLTYYSLPGQVAAAQGYAVF